MRELHIGTGVLIVSDDVCSAVFDYAAALAMAGRADVVNVPILLDGQLGDANLVLTPSSQLYCTPAMNVSAHFDFDDHDCVADIRRREAALPSNALAAFAMETYPDFSLEVE